MPTTIKDVAKAADVSISTVSRVTNNVPNVSKELRRRVLRVITQLEYTPGIINSPNAPTQNILFPTRIVTRDSVCPPPIEVTT